MKHLIPFHEHRYFFPVGRPKPGRSVLLLLLVFGVWGLCGPLAAQPPVLETTNITERDGLLGYYNHDIIQHSRGFLWIASSLGLTRYDGYRFHTYTSFDKGLSGVNVETVQEYRDGRLAVLYLYERRFLDLFDPEGEIVENIPLTERSGISGVIADVYLEPRGDIFVLSQDFSRQYVQRYAGKGKFERLFSLSSPSFSGKEPVARLFHSRQGQFWISDRAAGLRVSDSTGTILKSFYASDFGNAGTAFARILYQDRQGTLWFSPQGEKGVFAYDPGQRKFLLYRALPTDQYYDRVWEDQLGNLLWKCGRQEWYSPAVQLYFLGNNGRIQDYSFLNTYNQYILSIFGHDFSRTVYAGTGSIIRKVRFNQLSLKTYLSQPFEEGQWGISIRGIKSDRRGQVFFIREVDSWYRLDLASQRFDTIPLRVTDRGDSIFWRQGGGIHVDEQAVWSVGRLNRQQPCLMRYDRTNETFRAYPYPLLFEDFAVDRQGYFWLVAGNEEKAELVGFDPVSESFHPYRDADGGNPLQGLGPIRILQVRDGSFWIGASSGLVHVDARAGRSEVFGRGDNRAGLTNNIIEAIYEDSDGSLWLGTNGGINVFDPIRKVVRARYQRSDGLVGNRVSNIYPDSVGNLWVSTYSGLSYFDRRERRFYNLNRSDGLPFEEINRRTVYLDEGGRLYMGGLNGAASLLPADVRRKTVYPAPMLTRWQQFDLQTDSLSVRETGLEKFRSVKLTPNVLFFECFFALPSYDQPQTHQYSAWLEGYDHNWNFLGSQPSIRYNKLPAGKYRLHIRAMDGHGNVSREHLIIRIRVTEVFYRTPWFWVMGFLIALAVGLWIYRGRLDRKMAIQQARQLHELDVMKTRFYANITHEFRTPLTIIMGLTGQLFRKLTQEGLREDLSRVRQNAERLLHLVNQVLDLRKLESGHLQPQWVQGDIVPLLRHFLESMRSLAESRRIELVYTASAASIVIDHDPEFYRKIISNLLSNALKFTPAGGRVTLEVRETGPEVQLRVQDTGIGISEEEISRIFDRFYQASVSKNLRAAGTGIGLTLAKELIDALNGTVDVRSQLGIGSTFTVRLPITRRASFEDAPEGEAPSTPDEVALFSAARIPNSPPPGEKPLILIVEDNQELADYLHSCLEEDYQVSWAPDGEAGIFQAIELIPDIIVSDVMMPRRDGFQLCQTLKSDQRTSHIPIILLTARIDYEDRLEGLKRGADAYLAKPFQEEELRLQIHNLLALTERLRQELLASSAAAEQEGAIPREAAAAVPPSPFDLPMEDAFLRRVEQIITDNLANPDFTVMDLCQEMAMSKSQLHRKLTALINEPASRLIRSLRLKRAMKLLQSTDATISEIAFETGFNDPSYFTRIFNQDIGMTPSDYRTQFYRG